MSKVSGKVSRALVSISLLAVLAGCNSSATEGLGVGQQASSSAAAQPVTPVVQAFCPPVVMRDEAAFHRVYARGGQDNPDKLLYQASLADATRQCTANETTLTINVVAQGRLVAGPAGATGPIALPIRVDVVDGDNVIHSEVVKFSVDLPAGTPSTQFVFNKPDVTLPNAPGGASRFTRVRIGFDTGPAKKARS